jgi:hypothetical protein
VRLNWNDFGAISICLTTVFARPTVHGQVLENIYDNGELLINAWSVVSKEIQLSFKFSRKTKAAHSADVYYSILDLSPVRMEERK